MKLSIKNKNKQDIFNIQWWQLFNMLSIDVVIGALAGGVMAVKLLNVNPDFAWWVVLALSVWIIYTVDHLIDGVKLKEKSHTLRHFFHYYYAKQIITVITILGIINIFLIVFFLNPVIIRFGLYTGAGTSLYLFVVYLWGEKRSLLLQKELFVALIYTTGIWGGPIALRSFHITNPEIFFISAFFLTVYMAVLVLSVFEVKYDKLDKHNTFAVNFGTNKTTYLIYFLITVVFILSIGEIIAFGDIYLATASKILLIMTLLLLIISKSHNKLEQYNIYRILIELVFWIPGLLLLAG